MKTLKLNFFVAIFFIAFIFPQCVLANRLKIESKIGNGKWEKDNQVEVLQAQHVFLKINRIENSSIKWFQIVPQLDVQYNNAEWPWSRNAYKWRGYADIKYSRIHLSQFDGKWEIEPIQKNENYSSSSVNPSLQSKIAKFFARLMNMVGESKTQNSFQHRDVGSFWYQAEVVANKNTYKSPGIESNTEKGLSPEVLRVSVRQGNDFIGYLTSYFNVPGVFGSTPYQVRNYIGVDCADVLMAAYSKWKNTPVINDYNVAMLTDKFQTQIKTTITHGQPGGNIYWGKNVRAGDLIAVKYQGSSQYQHIGALYQDKNGNGLLDSEDIVIHAGPDPLHFSDLGSEGFDGVVVILRPI